MIPDQDEEEVFDDTVLVPSLKLHPEYVVDPPDVTVQVTVWPRITIAGLHARVGSGGAGTFGGGGSQGGQQPLVSPSPAKAVGPQFASEHEKQQLMLAYSAGMKMVLKGRLNRF